MQHPIYEDLLKTVTGDNHEKSEDSSINQDWAQSEWQMGS